MQNNKTASDKSEIDHITRTFFDIFTNADNKQPDWTVIGKICISETIIIKKIGTDEEVYDLNSFIEPRKKILGDGTLRDFREQEIKEETFMRGNIAQRFSTYEKSGYLNEQHFKASGYKFFQFIKTKEGWKISSMIWEDDNA